MALQEGEQTVFRQSVGEPPVHSLYECCNAEEFCTRFESFTGQNVQYVADKVVAPTASRAIFITGSIPLGMATNGSDVDLIVLVDSKDDVLLGRHRGEINNTQQCLAFSNESDLLRAGLFMTVMNGMTVEVSVVITPYINRVYSRLRSRGPELSESEVMTLGRLSTGWLLTQNDGYLERSGVVLTDPALGVYCSTKSFVFALIYRQKANKALDLLDIPQALYLGRLSVEMAYLAYFASEGFPYLGAKWLAQIGHARGAAERVSRHPLLGKNVHLLFPSYGSSAREVVQYLRAVSDVLTSMRNLIEQKTLFRIAFKACPQIYSIA